MEFSIQYSKIRIVFRGSKSNFRNLAIFPCLAIFLCVCSCASLPWKIGRDDFSRIYAIDFISFYPKVNSVLQDYAKKRKGNSFQVTRLGNDAVIIRGLCKGEQYQDRFSTTITVKPRGPKRTRMEIKISSGNPAASSKDLEMAARELFQIVEKGTGIPPVE